MTEQKEVYLVVTKDNNLDCTGPHVTFYPTEVEAKESLKKCQPLIGAKVLYIHGFIEAEQVGE